MPLILDCMDTLRLKFNRYRNGRTYLALEKEIKVSRVLLSHFATGGRVGIESLVKLDAWCEQQALCQSLHDDISTHGAPVMTPQP